MNSAPLVTLNNTPSSISLLFYRDLDRHHEFDGEFNKTGYLTRSGTVIHLQGRRLRESSRADIEKWRPNVREVVLTAAECQAAEFLFTKRPRDPSLFGACMNGLVKERLVSMAEMLRPIAFEPITTDERRDRWNRLLSEIKTGDLLFTFNSASWISKLISRVDRGPWSHCAMYVGGGLLHEAIITGVCVRPIDVYFGPDFRVGLYRLPLPDGAEKVLERAKWQIGDKYSYRKAILCGLQKMFGFRRTVPSPNDMLMIPEIELVAIV
jgi:hypothetical protein